MKRQNEGKHTNSANPVTPLDRILESEEPILPSSGFLAAVMERVEEESRAPALIPFPWKRAILAIPFIIGVIGWFAYEFQTCVEPHGLARLLSAISPEGTGVGTTFKPPIRLINWSSSASMIPGNGRRVFTNVVGSSGVVTRKSWFWGSPRARVTEQFCRRQSC